MNRADEMFKELGYRKNVDNDYQVCYINKRDSHIYFYKKSKELDLAGKSQHNKILPLAQLQAINEKVKELGWEV